MSTGQITYIVLIFVTVFLLAQGLVVPVFGESAQAAKRLKKRLAAINSVRSTWSVKAFGLEGTLEEWLTECQALAEKPPM